MREVSPDFVYSHIFWVTLIVKQDEIADVVNVGLLSFEAEVFKTDGLPDLIEQAWRLRLRHGVMMDKSGVEGVIQQK